MPETIFMTGVTSQAPVEMTGFEMGTPIQLIGHTPSSNIVMTGYQGVVQEIVMTGQVASRGEQGVQGETGVQGEQGIQGIQGEIGPQGPTGETGPAGATGPAGTADDTPYSASWDTDTTAPSKNTVYDKLETMPTDSDLASAIAAHEADTTSVHGIPDTTTLISLTGTQTLTNKRITKRVVTLTDGATITPNGDTTDVGVVTLGGNRTMAAPTGTPTDAQQLIFRVKQDGTGTRTITWNAIYRFGTDVIQPVLTTTPAKTDYIGFQYNAVDSKWDCLSVARGY